MHGGSKRKKKNNRNSKRKSEFDPAAAVGGTSSMDVIYLLVGLVPCYPVCRLLPTYPPRFPLYSSCCLPYPRARVRGFFPHSCCPPLSQLPWILPTVDMSGSLLTAELHPRATQPGTTPRYRFHAVLLHSKLQGGVFRLPFVHSKLPKIYDYASMPCLKLSVRSWTLSAIYRPGNDVAGIRSLL